MTSQCYSRQAVKVEPLVYIFAWFMTVVAQVSWEQFHYKMKINVHLYPRGQLSCAELSYFQHLIVILYGWCLLLVSVRRLFSFIGLKQCTGIANRWHQFVIYIILCETSIYKASETKIDENSSIWYAAKGGSWIHCFSKHKIEILNFDKTL